MSISISTFHEKSVSLSADSGLLGEAGEKMGTQAGSKKRSPEPGLFSQEISHSAFFASTWKNHEQYLDAVSSELFNKLGVRVIKNLIVEYLGGIYLAVEEMNTKSLAPFCAATELCKPYALIIGKTYLLFKKVNSAHVLEMKHPRSRDELKRFIIREKQICLKAKGCCVKVSLVNSVHNSEFFYDKNSKQLILVDCEEYALQVNFTPSTQITCVEIGGENGCFSVNPIARFQWSELTNISPDWKPRPSQMHRGAVLSKEFVASLPEMEQDPRFKPWDSGSHIDIDQDNDDNYEKLWQTHWQYLENQMCQRTVLSKEFVASLPEVEKDPRFRSKDLDSDTGATIAGSSSS